MYSADLNEHFRRTFCGDYIAYGLLKPLGIVTPLVLWLVS